MKATLFCILLNLVIISNAHGFWYDGVEIKENCLKTGAQDEAFCVGYLAAAATAALTERYCKVEINGRVLYQPGTFGSCEQLYEIKSPDEMSLGQVKAIVVKFLEDNPGELHRSGVSLVKQAIWQAFGVGQIEQ